MYEPFWRLAAATEALVTLLAGLSLLAVAVYSRTDDSFPKKLLRPPHKDELNREAREARAAAYYEGPLSEGSRVSGMNALVAENERFTAESWYVRGEGIAATSSTGTCLPI